MKMNVLIILGVFFFGFSTVQAKANPIKEGKWNMTIVTHMDNMPPEMAQAMQQMQNLPPQIQAMMKAHNVQMSGNGQEMTSSHTSCITMKNPIPHYTKNPQTENYCQQTHDIQGNTVNFHMSCNHDDFQMESSGTMTYSGDNMQGHIKSHESNKGHTMDTSMDVTGQYLGACDK